MAGADVVITMLPAGAHVLSVWNWLLNGLEAVERLIAPTGSPVGPFCFGAAVTLADVCLIPQLYNARRFETPLDHLPRILAVEAACTDLPAFRAAHPARQADAQ